MVYITGDMHGDRQCFKDRRLKKLKKKDTLIVLGDFGFLWDGSKAEMKFLGWLSRRRYHIAFVTGTHDNYKLLKSYPQSDWNGGKVRRIKGELLMLERGNLYDIDGKKYFAFGGGHSEDYFDREQDATWWPQELPTQDEMNDGLNTLKNANMECDYIITHDAPGSIRRFILMDNSEITEINDYFDKINSNCRFQHWYFGCYHMDKVITSRHTGVYKLVLPIKPKK